MYLFTTSNIIVVTIVAFYVYSLLYLKYYYYKEKQITYFNYSIKLITSIIKYKSQNRNKKNRYQ